MVKIERFVYSRTRDRCCGELHVKFSLMMSLFALKKRSLREIISENSCQF